MNIGELRHVLVRWATHQALVRRVHLVGPQARGMPSDSAVHLVIELDARVDFLGDATVLARWQAQLSSALALAVALDHIIEGSAGVQQALRTAHVCLFERSARDGPLILPRTPTCLRGR